MGSYSIKLDKSKEGSVKKFFEADGATFLPQQSAFWRAKKNEYSAIFYNTGKFLIQGSDIDDIVNKFEVFYGLKSATQTTLLCVPENNPVEADVPAQRIGVDESGKGDFFGPLVIAGVMVDEKNTDILVQAGVKDCKKVEDKNINKLAAVIKNNCVFSVVTVKPAKYNELYSKFKNLNHLLAWGHARAIENILEKKDCGYALSDKFADERLIKNALIDKGKNIKLEQRHKAESDIAVAAASILARAQFLSVMNELSTQYGVEIPKGASDRVVQVAKQIKDKFGKEELKNVAKTHFKTYSQI